MKSIFSKRNLKFGVFVVASISFVLLSIFVLLVLNISSQTKALATSDNLPYDLEKWAKKIEFLKVFPDSNNSNFNGVPTMKALDSYISNYPRFNALSIVKLPNLEMLDYTEKQIVETDNIIQNDDNFFEGEKYLFSSDNTPYSVYSYFKLKIDDKETTQIEIKLSQDNIGNYNTEVTGYLNKEKVVETIKGKFVKLLSLTTDNEIEQSLKISNIKDKFSSINPVSFDLQILEKDGVLNVGKLNLEQKDSKYVDSIDVFYDRNLREFKFLNIFDTLSQIPEVKKIVVSTPTPSPSNIVTINCSDCFLAPVDKYHSLPSSYTPSVTNVTLSGGGQLTNDALSALKDLNSDASNNGISITVISSYRSYQTQVTTFNYWVGQQKKNGLSQSQAEIQANRISARAGQSEHQLGTTADLKCSSCGNFDNSAKNILLYQYLEKNAHKFGFVISYPKGKEALTGYSYEPWHIRYIGIDLATGFFNKNYITEPNLSSTILLAQR